jgi:hypothetical protein
MRKNIIGFLAATIVGIKLALAAAGLTFIAVALSRICWAWPLRTYGRGLHACGIEAFRGKVSC